MDGHWEWSDASGDDTGETADLAGELGNDLGGDLNGGHDGFDPLGHDHLGGDDPAAEHGTGDHGYGDDLEEPLGTENAAEAYDESVQSLEHDLHDDAEAFETLEQDTGGDGYGSDPDLTGDDAGWHETQFPQELHLDDPPEPVDGFPWSDADVLGDPTGDYDPAAADGGAEPGDLASYAGADLPAGDPWAMLLGSDDPATSSLAGFWAPNIA